MKHAGLIVVLALTLAACSGRDDREPKMEAVSIDKADIDIAKMNLFFKDTTPTTNWNCSLLIKSEPEDDAAQLRRTVAMHNRPVQITAGKEVLATGQISGVMSEKGRYSGLSINFASPQTIDELEKKVGIRRPELPPALK